MTNGEFKQELKQEIIKSESEIKSNFSSKNVLQTSGIGEFLTDKNFANIQGLYQFAIKHKELQGSQIEALVKQNANTFKFLNQFVNSIEDVVDEMRVHGMMYCAVVYCGKLARIKDIKKIEKASYKLP